RAIEIPGQGRMNRNNLVEWTNRYGPKGVSHRRLVEARKNRLSRRKLEHVLFALYRRQVAESGVFEGLCALAGKRYDLIAYLFFLKDWERFMPISTSN